MNSGEFLSDFLNEAVDYLDAAENGLLELEAQGEAQPEERISCLNAIFRSFHTLKGTAGFFDLTFIVRLAHSAEEILEDWRAEPGRLDAENSLIPALLSVCDSMRRACKDVAEKGSDEAFSHEAERLINELKSHRLAGPKTEENPVHAQESVPDTEEAFGLFEDHSSTARPQYLPSLEDTKSGWFDPIQASPGYPQEQEERPDPTNLTREEIRVPATRIDSVVEMVGELVILDSVLQRLDESQKEALNRTRNQLSGIVRRLQEIALSLRMVPLDRVFRRLPRIVADQKRSSNKKIEVQVSGGEIEIDKSICDTLIDPLTHLVRNATAHGIEEVDERKALGKPENGRVQIEALHAGSEVWIRVTDDGRGVQSETIEAKAIEKGLLTAPGALSREALLQLVFHPGFSTAAEITNISGRGVGLDAVQTRIKELKGRIEVWSTPGQGTTFELRIPLTLSIVAGMIVRSADQYLVIPTLDIRFSAGIKDCSITHLPGQRTMLRYEDEVYPAVEPAALLGCDTKPAPDYPVTVVIGRDNRQLALLIDEIVGSQNVVIKPLPKYMESVRGFAGCTILGDGAVSLIVDAQRMLESSYAFHASEQR